MELKFWGTRGSIPVPGEKTLKYGGNTSCVQVTLDSGKVIIVDAGSGIRELGNYLLQNSHISEVHIFISHTHWDHIQGLPFFAPLFRNNYKINILSAKKMNIGVSQIIEWQINNYFFPINSENLQSNINYVEIMENEVIKFDNATITPVKVKHSEGTFGYKFHENGKTIVYMTDNEIDYDLIADEITLNNVSRKNSELIDFCRGADYLIHDSMYLYEDYKKMWGHSNHISVAVFSHLAQVKNLVLFHYDPDYNDEIVETLLARTKEKLAQLNSDVKCIAAYEGLVI